MRIAIFEGYTDSRGRKLGAYGADSPAEASPAMSTKHVVIAGVITGLLVWAITRFAEKKGF
jgi:hypothetical protein